jgi:hypothetical protein
VAFGPGLAADSTIFGELCATQTELADGATAQLLIHGGSYDQTFGNFGTYDGVRLEQRRTATPARRQAMGRGRRMTRHGLAAGARPIFVELADVWVGAGSRSPRICSDAMS